jgi:hypothetical protein
VRSFDLGPDGQPIAGRPLPPAAAPKPAPPKRPTGPRWRGCVPAGAAAAMLVALIPAFSVLLMVLSVLGTFYGARGLPVPIFAPATIWANINELRWGFALAVVAQGVLSIAQWGGRQLAQSDRRWWLLYGAALSLSVYWNWEGYWPTLQAVGIPWLVALLIIAVADIEPEVGLIRAN